MIVDKSYLTDTLNIVYNDPNITDEYINENLNRAQLGVNFLLSGAITTETSFNALDERIQTHIKNAIGYLADYWITKNTFNEGESTSASTGSLSYSETNQRAVGFIPEIVKNELELSGLYVRQAVIGTNNCPNNDDKPLVINDNPREFFYGNNKMITYEQALTLIKNEVPKHIGDVFSENVEISDDEKYTNETTQKALNIKLKEKIAEALNKGQFSPDEKQKILGWINQLDTNGNVNANKIFYQLQPSLAKELLNTIIQNLKNKTATLTSAGTLASQYITADKDGTIQNLQSWLDEIWHDIDVAEAEREDNAENISALVSQLNQQGANITRIQTKNNEQDILINANTNKTRNLNEQGKVINEPTSDDDIANKKYVDDNAGGGSGAENTSQLTTTDAESEGGNNQQEVNEKNKTEIDEIKTKTDKIFFLDGLTEGEVYELVEQFPNSTFLAEKKLFTLDFPTPTSNKFSFSTIKPYSGELGSSILFIYYFEVERDVSNEIDINNFQFLVRTNWIIPSNSTLEGGVNQNEINKKLSSPTNFNFFGDILQVDYLNDTQDNRYAFTNLSFTKDSTGLGFTAKGNLTITNSQINSPSELKIESVFYFDTDNNRGWLNNKTYLVSFVAKTPNKEITGKITGEHKLGSNVGGKQYHIVSGELDGEPSGENKLDSAVGEWIIHFKLNYVE